LCRRTFTLPSSAPHAPPSLLPHLVLLLFFFFTDTPPPEISPLSLHDALPIWARRRLSPSSGEPCQTAAAMPSGMPIDTASARLAPASISVAGRRCRSSLMIGLPLR